jgi:hypothetical protein
MLFRHGKTDLARVFILCALLGGTTGIKRRGRVGGVKLVEVVSVESDTGGG